MQIQGCLYWLNYRKHLLGKTTEQSCLFHLLGFENVVVGLWNMNVYKRMYDVLWNLS